MKIALSFLLFISITFCCCKQTKISTSAISVDNSKIFILDSSYQDSVEHHIQFISDKHFSQFKTPIEAYYFLNDKLVDSIIQPDFDMMSWYSINKDTIDLVAHVGELETEAFLISFIGDKRNVFFFRAPHLSQNYFRLNKTDSFSNQLKVPLLQYKLLLSKIPDTINKSVIYGHIDMESSGYYDKRDTLQRKRSIKMKFYFRSQFRKFDY